jgi:hypothetical protein
VPPNLELDRPWDGGNTKTLVINPFSPKCESDGGAEERVRSSIRTGHDFLATIYANAPAAALAGVSSMVLGVGKKMSCEVAIQCIAA